MLSDGCPAPGVLAVCTANRCRSVMAEAFLVRELAEADVAARVWSAGLGPAGQPAPAEVISAMRGHGLDVTGHRSRLLTAADLTSADLVVTMTREHVRRAAVLEPAAWPRSFTLKEIVRRGEQAGPRARGESLPDWVARVHAGRERAALLGDSPDDDVADPIGGPPQAYMLTAALLDQLIGRLVGLCWAPALDGRPGLAGGGLS